jgi:hypothetical protein
VRFGGLAIRHHGAQDRAAAQFSIRSLLLMTTMVAVAIACLERLRPHLAWSPASFSRLDFLWEPIRDLTSQVAAAHGLRLAVLSSVASGVVAAAIWAVMRPGNPWLRVVATGVIAAATGVYLAHLVGDWPNWMPASGLVILAALVGTSVLPLRLMGFRLARAARCRTKVSATRDGRAGEVESHGIKHEESKDTKQAAIV